MHFRAKCTFSEHMRSVQLSRPMIMYFQGVSDKVEVEATWKCNRLAQKVPDLSGGVEQKKASSTSGLSDL
jgi:hypothetical protein